MSIIFIQILYYNVSLRGRLWSFVCSTRRLRRCTRRRRARSRLRWAWTRRTRLRRTRPRGLFGLRASSSGLWFWASAVGFLRFSRPRSRRRRLLSRRRSGRDLLSRGWSFGLLGLLGLFLFPCRFCLRLLFHNGLGFTMDDPVGR